MNASNEVGSETRILSLITYILLLCPGCSILGGGWPRSALYSWKEPERMGEKSFSMASSNLLDRIVELVYCDDFKSLALRFNPFRRGCLGS